MNSKKIFKWKHYQPEIIILCVRWYLSYSLSYRNLQEMMNERGLGVAHTTIMRWVHQFAVLLDLRVRPHLKLTNDYWKVDETYIKVKGVWMYLYRAVDSDGNTLDFMLSKNRDNKAAKRFFEKVLGNQHTQKPRVINVDKNAAYPIAFNDLKKEKQIEESSELRQIKYLNNMIEQDHRGIKRITNAGLGYYSFETAYDTICGIETMRMIKKRQLNDKDFCGKNRMEIVNSLFGIAA